MPYTRLIVRAVLAIMLVVLAAEGRAAEPIKDSDCLNCHNDDSLTKTNAAGKEISLFVDEAKLGASTHKTNTCASCHNDIFFWYGFSYLRYYS